MEISVIIVNYNVKFFLEQCLYSALSAARFRETEIFVVDNNSVDGSCDMVREKFSDVRLIENKNNFGFSYANNQAIKLAKGKYILMLNPDTVVEEDTFNKVVSFMDEHADAGGLGVKMIDGKGNFLPESKRGLPTPSVAFYKIFGISRLFPRSRIFNRYHLGYLDKDKVHEVDVLAGAFMVLRKSVLDKTGLLDETYFMYGEDIDLSYRIIKAGYKNYYYPGTTIIHYKGESTKKGSMNYVKVFYNAMIIFARKHFSKQHARSFAFLINLAIYIRAVIAIFTRLIRNLLLPLLDAIMIFIGFFLVKPYWEQYKFHGSGQYPDEYLMYVVPGYIIVWLISILLTGGYDRPAKMINIIKGIVGGTFLILVIYALLNEQFRFSRALILIGSAWAFMAIMMIRLFFQLVGVDIYKLYSSKRKRVAIIGYEDEVERVTEILKKSEYCPNIIGYIDPDEEGKTKGFIGNVQQMREIIKINRIEELIFCARDITAQKIIKNMLILSDDRVEYKIASPDSISVVGSNSINSSGDLYTININSIARAENKRNKRLFDILSSIILMSFFPVFMIFQRRPLNFIVNVFRVFIGVNTWVGYQKSNNHLNAALPKIKQGIISPADVEIMETLHEEVIDRLNIAYARDFKILNDLVIVIKAFRLLGK